MKALLLFAGFFTAGAFYSNRAFAQADIAAPVGGHQGGTNTGYYLGWDATTTLPLNIEHRSTTQPVRFLLGSTERMRITPNGFVGIGTNNPQNLLQIHNPAMGSVGAASRSFTQWTTGLTNATGNDGLQIGITATPNGFTGTAG